MPTANEEPKFENLIYTKRDGEARITLNQPDRLNALGVGGAVDLRRVLEVVVHDSDVRVLVITGSGRGFCAGGDVASFHDNAGHTHRVLGPILLNLHAAIHTLANLNVPVIAGINGVTAGAGMGLCLAADLAIAVEEANFTMAYTGIGATPDGSSTFFLPRLIGTRRALELALTNRTLSAREALEWGLINKVVSAADFAGELDQLAQRLKSGPTVAFAHTRKLIRDSVHTTLADQLENEGRSLIAAGKTKDFREGVAAFLARRKPGFEGR